MRRRSLDRLISWVGLTLTAILIVAGSLLTWGHDFVTHEVKTQLAAQQIFFPAKGSPATAAAAFAPMREYAGQQLTTGAQAETYADHFIAVHLIEIGGGKTHAQLSAEATADPSDTKLAATVETVFEGETLRGLLLNAYAFGTMGTLAAIGAFVGALVMLLLSGLGLWHSRGNSDTRPEPLAVTPNDPVPAGGLMPRATAGASGWVVWLIRLARVALTRGGVTGAPSADRARLGGSHLRADEAGPMTSSGS